jgi:L-threonylcarbamoyladenylate synthase
LIEDVISFSPNKNQRVGLLAWNPVESENNFAAVRYLSERQDLREAAANLFRYLRELDVSNVDLIVAEQVPDRGLGAAIMDRLRRAAHRPVDAKDRPE